MTESHKIPPLAKTAASLLQREFNTNLNAIASQAVQALGFDDGDEWHCDFSAGTISREIPDPPKVEAPAEAAAEPPKVEP